METLMEVWRSLEKFREVNTIWQVGTFLSTMNNTKLLYIGLSNKFLLKKEVAILCFYLSLSLFLSFPFFIAPLQLLFILIFDPVMVGQFRTHHIGHSY